MELHVRAPEVPQVAGGARRSVWQPPVLMVPTSMRGADGVDGTTLKWLLKFAFMKKRREEAKKEEAEKEEVMEERMSALNRRVHDGLPPSLPEDAAWRQWRGLPPRQEKRRKKKRKAPRTWESGHSSLRALRSWQSLSCVAVLLGFPWFDCGYLCVRQLEAFGRIQIILREGGPRILGRFTILVLVRRLGGASGVQANWISVLFAMLGLTVDTSSCVYLRSLWLVFHTFPA